MHANGTQNVFSMIPKHRLNVTLENTLPLTLRHGLNLIPKHDVNVTPKHALNIPITRPECDPKRSWISLYLHILSKPSRNDFKMRIVSLILTTDRISSFHSSHALNDFVSKTATEPPFCMLKSSFPKKPPHDSSILHCWIFSLENQHNPLKEKKNKVKIPMRNSNLSRTF